MRVTFIRPCIGRPRPGKFETAAIQPLQLSVLAALTPDSVDVKLYDDRVEPIPFHEPTDLVALTVETFTAKRAYEIAARYRAMGVKVVMGGMHPTLLPKEVSLHADSVFVGDAETLWGTLIADFMKGALKPLYRALPTIPQAGTFPRRELFKGKKYLPLSLLQFSRGCPHRCTFCAPTTYFKGKHYLRQIDAVVREIVENKLKIVLFVDDNFTANPRAARELMRELIPLKIIWGSQASIEMTRDPELMRLMADSGCFGHVIGLESTDEQNLVLMNKKQNMGSDYSTVARIMGEYGLSAWAALTVGHDSDTPDSIARLVDQCIEAKFAYAAVNMLCPYPATPLYRSLNKQNRLLYDGKWWLHNDYRYNGAAFIPKRMTPEELTLACHNGWERFYSAFKITRRLITVPNLIHSPFRLALHIFYNAILRKDFLLNDGMSFGGEGRPQ
ncbi:B12-binding domain-containing radical SAM protein [Myxococcota bacterium]|nr:B12-binding domain-containing radical SAM protein [Myxococcota bacterium]